VVQRQRRRLHQLGINTVTIRYGFLQRTTEPRKKFFVRELVLEMVGVRHADIAMAARSAAFFGLGALDVPCHLSTEPASF
jgi:hypothetical protein